MNVVAINPEPEPDGFDAFWILYPRHVAKKDARKAWGRIPADVQVGVITATAAWRLVWLKRGEVEFIPYPATWLNGERWEDELPADGSRTAISSSHVAFGKSEPLAARGEIPEAVRQQIRKLTGRA